MLGPWCTKPNISIDWLWSESRDRTINNKGFVRNAFKIPSSLLIVISPPPPHWFFLQSSSKKINRISPTMDRLRTVTCIIKYINGNVQFSSAHKQGTVIIMKANHKKCKIWHLPMISKSIKTNYKQILSKLLGFII